LHNWDALWRGLIDDGNLAEISTKMKQTNPKYTWREWLVIPAYQQAMQGDYRLVKELQAVFSIECQAFSVTRQLDSRV
jgi:uncharacterized protein YdiU (UPF0061 family)